MTDVRDKVLGVLKYHRWNYDLVDFASGLKFHRKDLDNGVVNYTGPCRTDFPMGWGLWLGAEAMRNLGKGLRVAGEEVARWEEEAPRVYLHPAQLARILKVAPDLLEGWTVPRSSPPFSTAPAPKERRLPGARAGYRKRWRGGA